MIKNAVCLEKTKHHNMAPLIRHFTYGPSLEPIQARNAAHSNNLRPPRA